jgi:uncharacterized protein affecting Mg2+/Co2+ transport
MDLSSFADLFSLKRILISRSKYIDFIWHIWRFIFRRITRTVCAQFPGLPALEISTPAVLQDVSDVISRMFNFVLNDPTHFPPMDRHFTAVYSRDREYLWVHKVYLWVHEVFVSTQSICEYTKYLWVHKVFVSTQSICKYTKHLWVHEVFVSTQSICEYTKYLWVHKVYLWVHEVFVSTQSTCEYTKYLWVHKVFVSTQSTCEYTKYL